MPILNSPQMSCGDGPWARCPDQAKRRRSQTTLPTSTAHRLNSDFIYQEQMLKACLFGDIR